MMSFIKYKLWGKFVVKEGGKEEEGIVSLISCSSYTIIIVIILIMITIIIIIIIIIMIIIK